MCQWSSKQTNKKKILFVLYFPSVLFTYTIFSSPSFLFRAVVTTFLNLIYHKRDIHIAQKAQKKNNNTTNHSVDVCIFRNGREARNRAEKHRRDKLNGSIQELSTMVPHVAESPRRVDKTAVLRFSAHGLRIDYGECYKIYLYACIMVILFLTAPSVFCFIIYFEHFFLLKFNNIRYCFHGDVF